MNVCMYVWMDGWMFILLIISQYSYHIHFQTEYINDDDDDDGVGDEYANINNDKSQRKGRR